MASTPHMPNMDPPVFAQHVPALPELAPERFSTSQKTSSSTHSTQPSGSVSSSRWVEPVRIPVLSRSEAERTRIATRPSEGNQLSLPIPPRRAKFEAYGGKQTGWCAYDEATQEILREAYTCKDIAFVRMEDSYGNRSYAVNIDPAYLT